jgi:hypothetical protein
VTAVFPFEAAMTSQQSNGELSSRQEKETATLKADSKENHPPPTFDDDGDRQRYWATQPEDKPKNKVQSERQVSRTSGDLAHRRDSSVERLQEELNSSSLLVEPKKISAGGRRPQAASFSRTGFDDVALAISIAGSGVRKVHRRQLTEPAGAVSNNKPSENYMDDAWVKINDDK